MGWFFTKAALLTFGGAYAVLPYVVSGRGRDLRLAHAGADDRRPGARRDDARAADHGRRVRRLRRRLDARQLFGPTRCSLAGVAGACVATFFTFLPSLPVHPRRRAAGRDRRTASCRFTAPLTGITAAVVGVIVNLAVFFAWHVFWPRRMDGAARSLVGGLDPLLARQSASSRRLALFRFKAGRDSGDPRMRCGAEYRHPSLR